MSSNEKKDLIQKLNYGLKISFENLLHRKAALGQDMVFADEKGKPLVIPAKEALNNYLKSSGKQS